MFITYSNFEEAIVCIDATEKETLRIYFDEGGRDLEDYNRTECPEEAVFITSKVVID